MINGFLQFLKKQKLAIHLAREDMLFLLYSLNMFQKTLLLSRFFLRKSSATPSQRVEIYINKHQNSLLSVYATTLALSYGVTPPHRLEEKLTGDVDVKHAISSKDIILGEELLPQLALSNPKLDEDYLLNMLELNSDMRLYGAEFSEIQNYTSECKGILKLAVDWQKTTAEKLYILFSEEVKNTEKLSPQAQQNLAQMFFYLLYRKSYLILDWDSILINSRSEVFLLNFSVLRNLSKSQQAYAFQNIMNGKAPLNIEENNIKRALDLLKLYCPQADMSGLTKRYGTPILSEFKTHDTEWAKKNTEYYQNLEAEDGHKRVQDTRNNIFLRLKSKSTLSVRGKTSIYYWWPLILAACLLYFLL